MGKPLSGCCKVERLPWHSRSIYAWSFENGVEFGAKRFRLPEAFAVLEKPPRRVGAESPGAWLAASTKRGAQALFPGGVGRVAVCWQTVCG